MKVTVRRSAASRASPQKRSLLTKKGIKSIDSLCHLGLRLDESVERESTEEISREQIDNEKNALSSALATLDIGIFCTQIGIGVHYIVTGETSKAVSTFASALSTLGKILRDRLKTKR